MADISILPANQLNREQYAARAGVPVERVAGEFGNFHILDIVPAVIQGMKEKGLTINPNIPITPQAAAEFMTFAAQNANVFLPYAEKELAPYYQTQLKLASDAFQKQLGYNIQQIQQNEQDTQTKYSDILKNIGVSAAEKGFAQSGIRNLEEQNLATLTQNEINQGRRQLEYNAEDAGGNFAQKYGSETVNNLNIPTLSSAPRVLPGQSQFDVSGPSRSLYTLSPEVYNGLTGTEQFAERSAEQARAGQLEEAYNKYNVNSRTLPAIK